jgi:HlyD family secretion protein
MVLDERVAALFPDAPGAAELRRRRARRRRRVAATGAVAVVVAVSLVASQAFGSAGPGYRTATVVRRDVEATLTGVATIEPVMQAAVAFPVAGTVATVAVAPGQAVVVGQSLATLSTEALVQTLHAREATLANAQLTLERALAGESVSAGNGAGGSPTGTTHTAAVTTSARSITVVAATTSGRAAAQQAVLDAQQAVDAALADASTAMAAANAACAGIDSGSAPATGADSTTAADPTGTAACRRALEDVMTAQQSVAAAQTHLAQATAALDRILAQEAAASGAAAAGGSGGAAASSGSGSTASAPSSADLVQYQAAVDAATAGVAVAQQAIAQATIVSPIAGTVVAVGVVPGEAVSAASTTATVTIVGAGGFEATTTVGVDHIGRVAPGQTAAVLPDGATTPIAGKVTAISVTGSTVSSTVAYRVTIGLDGDTATLPNGSTGRATIVTDRAAGALAVPTSAVTTAGSRHTVRVLDGGTATDVQVEVGVVGASFTQVTGGLDLGRTVVLADLAEPLPGSATATATTATAGDRRRAFGSGGAFPGGAFPGGGTGSFRPGAGSGAAR